MMWFDYVKKTSVARMVVDWCEYMKLKKNLYRAEKDMAKSYSALVKYYGVDDNCNRFDVACIKCKQLPKNSGVFVGSVCCFSAQRCTYLGPKGNEQKCLNNSCAMCKENNLYFENKQKYNEYGRLCSQYWSNKFVKVR